MKRNILEVIKGTEKHRYIEVPTMKKMNGKLQKVKTGKIITSYKIDNKWVDAEVKEAKINNIEELKNMVK